MQQFETQPQTDKRISECSKALEQIKSCLDINERWKLYKKAHPFAYTPEQGHSLHIRENSEGKFDISDNGGFLTVAATLTELAFLLHEEHREPGALRYYLTGRNPIKEMEERMEQGRLRAIEVYNENNQDDISLEDLGL